MNDVVCFLLVEFLKERIGESAEVCSTRTGIELKIKIEGAEIEHDHLEEWLKKDFQHYGIRSLPYGFLAHNQDLSELFVVTISANKEFTSKLPLPSFVTVTDIRQSRRCCETSPFYLSPRRRFFGFPSLASFGRTQ